MRHEWATAYLYFWVGVLIKARNLHIRFGPNYFPRSYGLRRVSSFTSDLQAKDSGAERTCPNNFVSHGSAHGAKTRDIHHVCNSLGQSPLANIFVSQSSKLSEILKLRPPSCTNILKLARAWAFQSGCWRPLSSARLCPQGWRPGLARPGVLAWRSGPWFKMTRRAG